MTSAIESAALDPAQDPAIDRRTRAFLGEINQDSSPFWELPGDAPRQAVTMLQNKTEVDLSGVEVDRRELTVDGRTIGLYVVRPAGATGTLPVFMFFHGAVWIAGNFENHRRLVRDLVVGSRCVAVFPEYTPVPEAQFPVQIEQAHAAAMWVSEHGDELGVEAGRLAVTGNSVGGDMAAAVTLMAHDRGAPHIVYQQLLWPALSAALDTESYRRYGEGRFLPRAFMAYGWDHYAPDEDMRRHRYASPAEATPEQLRGLPPTLIITAENDVLRDEGEAYARQLDEAGVDVANVRYNGAIHDFALLNALRDVPSTDTALRQAAADLARTCRPPPRPGFIFAVETGRRTLWTASSRPCAPARAGRWSCAARPAWARPRCWSGWPSGRRTARSCGPPASRPRWSCRSPRCSSSARHCPIGSPRSRGRSARRSRRPSAWRTGRRRIASSSASR
jgi:acetyl esterase